MSAVPNLKGVDGEDAVMESYKEDLEVRIKPLQEAHPDLKINKQIVSGPAVSALTKAAGPVYVVPRKYVEAAESRLDTVPSSPAEVPTKSLEEIAGVEEIPVTKAEPEVAQKIEETIDPDRQ